MHSQHQMDANRLKAFYIYHWYITCELLPVIHMSNHESPFPKGIVFK